MKLWIVLPVYKDTEPFLKLRKDILAHLKKDDQLKYMTARFVVADDSGGLDPSMHQVKALPDTDVITCPYNMGHQRAIVYALRSYKDRIEENDIVVTMDSDGQDKPGDLPRLIRTFTGSDQNTNCLSIAWRTKRKEKLLFKIFYILFKMAFRVLTGHVVKSGNFASFTGTLLKRMIFHPYFDLCFSSTLVTIGFPIHYVGCERGDRIAGTGHMRFIKLIIHGLTMLMPFLDQIAVRFLLFFFSIFSGSVLLLLAAWGLPLVTPHHPPGWTFLALFFVMSLSIGAIFNLIILFTLFSQTQAAPFMQEDRIGSSRTPSSRAN